MKCLLICIVTILLMQYQNISFAQSSETATVTLQFDNVAGDEDIRLDSGIYTNAANEKFSISLLQYFISNIQFTGIDNKQYILPQDSCYFFVQEDDSASQICNVHVPVNEYKSVSFIVGVDSMRCTSKINDRKGVLDPSATDMYWGWNSGYIFLKIEGISPAAPEDAAGLYKYRYHIGGFGGYQSQTINNIKNIQLSIAANTVKLEPGSNSVIQIKADILKLFNGSTQVSIAKHPAIMFDAYSATIANNYASMFSVAAVKN
jgi:hypothetical protein